MAVNEHGEIAGAVSGGCVEGAVVEIAEQVLRGDAAAAACTSGSPTPRRGTSGCRAAARSTSGCRRTSPAASTRLRASGGRAAEVTLLEGAAPGREAADRGRRRALRARSARPSSTTRPRGSPPSCCGPSAPSGAGPLFIDVVAPAPRLILFGAVDIAASLCTLARDAGWRPYVVDPRARFATPERFPDAEEVIAAWPEEAFARLGGIDPGHLDRRAHPRPQARRRGADDRAALAGAVRRRDGLAPRPGGAARAAARAPGSATRSSSGCRRRSDSTSGAIEREETALSILAEVVAARHGRDGGRLATPSGRIHEVPGCDRAA